MLSDLPDAFFFFLPVTSIIVKGMGHTHEGSHQDMGEKLTKNKISLGTP